MDDAIRLLEEKIQEAARTVQSLRDEKATLESGLAEARQAVERLESEVVAAERRAAQTERELESAQAGGSGAIDPDEASRLREELATAQRAAEEAEGRADTLAQQLSELQEGLDERGDGDDGSDAEVAELRAANESLIAEREEIRGRIAALVETLEALS